MSEPIIAILSAAGQKAAPYAISYVLDEHLSSADAAKIKAILGLSPPKIAETLNEISDKVDRIHDIVRDIQADLLFKSFDDYTAKLWSIYNGYNHSLEEFHSFLEKEGDGLNLAANEAQLALSAAGQPDDTAAVEGYLQGLPAIREKMDILRSLDENLQASCKRALSTTSGIVTMLEDFTAVVSRPLQAYQVPIFQAFADILRQRRTDVLTFSKRTNQIYNTFLFNVILGTAITRDAKQHYRNPSRHPIKEYSLNNPTLVTLHQAYLKATGREHRAAHHLRDRARTKAAVHIRHAANNLFLTAYPHGEPLSEIPAVGSGENHGVIQTGYGVSSFQESKPRRMPQVFAANIAQGESLAIIIREQSTLMGLAPNVQQAAEALAKYIPDKRSAATLDRILASNSTPGTLVHDTASQLWRLEEVVFEGSDYFCLRNVQSQQLLASQSATWRTSLVTDIGKASVWAPILVDSLAKLPTLRLDDKMQFMLWNAHYGRGLSILTDLAVACNGDTATSSDGILWQFLSETVLPSETRLRPGAVIGSTDLAVSLVYDAKGGLTIHRDGKPLRTITLKHVQKGNGIPGVLRMQGDGNLVQHDGMGAPIAASGTDGHPNSVAILGCDGSFKVVAPDGTVTFQA